MEIEQDAPISELGVASTLTKIDDIRRDEARKKVFDWMLQTQDKIAQLIEDNERLRDALLKLERWDMLTLNADGHGVVTADAPWARALITKALGE